MAFIKNSQGLLWTAHSKAKMRFYGLSERRAKKVIRAPERIESGVAPDTIALMLSVKTSKRPYEIWVMVQETKTDCKVVSVWRYPGQTKPGGSLPDDIISELKLV